MVCLEAACLHASALNRFMAIIAAGLLCPVADNSIYPKNYAPYLRDGDDFDFIIVGAGSAGSVLANRLTENKAWRVLLIESGTYPDDLSEVPAFFPLTLQTGEAWHYKAEVGDFCKGYIDGRCNWPKGRLLGGTSGVNAMLFVHSNPQDHERWVNDGCDGWDWDTVKQYYDKLENTTSGTGMKTIRYNFQSRFPARQILLDNNKLVDTKGSPYLGFFEIPTNIYQGKRFSAAKGYVAPIKSRINAYLALNTLALQVIFNGNDTTARGVQVDYFGRRMNLYARKEVILSAGAVNSPQLLMLSGIGPKQHLQDVGIAPRLDLPVGKNMQDHLFLPLLATVPDHNALIGDYIQYCLNNKGNLGEVNVNNIMGFINTKNNSIYPNIQFHHYYLSELTTDAYLTMALYNVLTTAKVMSAHLLWDIVLFGATLLNPKSIGEIKLRDNQPTSAPLIYPNYLSNDEDYQLLLEAIRFTQYAIKTNPGFKGASLLDMGEFDCFNFKYDTDEYWRCVIYNFATSIYHPVGTSKMGAANDPRSVVDPQLRVVGANRLRVIDSSIIPLEVSGNTNVPTIMVAERGADLIKSDWM